MTLRERMQADLRHAMKERDRATVTVIRSLLGSIANAEAVEPDPAPSPSTTPLGSHGLSADTPRRALDAEDVRQIVLTDRAERAEALRTVQAHGATEQIARLKAELAVVDGYLDGLDATENGE